MRRAPAPSFVQQTAVAAILPEFQQVTTVEHQQVERNAAAEQGPR